VAIFDATVVGPPTSPLLTTSGDATASFEMAPFTQDEPRHAIVVRPIGLLVSGCMAPGAVVRRFVWA